MPIISSVTKFDNRTQKSGRRRVWYELTDHLDAVHTRGNHLLKSYAILPFSPEVIGAQTYDLVFDESTGESRLWDGAIWQIYRTQLHKKQETGLGENEAQEMIELIDRGDDPLPLIQSPEHSTSKKLAKKAIRYMMRKQDPFIVIILEPLIIYLRANYTSDQLIAFLDLTSPQAVKMNNRINAVLDNKTIYDTFDQNAEDIG